MKSNLNVKAQWNTLSKSNKNWILGSTSFVVVALSVGLGVGLGVDWNPQPQPYFYENTTSEHPSYTQPRNGFGKALSNSGLVELTAQMISENVVPIISIPTTSTFPIVESLLLALPLIANGQEVNFILGGWYSSGSTSTAYKYAWDLLDSIPGVNIYSTISQSEEDIDLIKSIIDLDDTKQYSIVTDRRRFNKNGFKNTIFLDFKNYWDNISSVSLLSEGSGDVMGSETSISYIPGSEGTPTDLNSLGIVNKSDFVAYDAIVKDIWSNNAVGYTDQELANASQYLQFANPDIDGDGTIDIFNIFYTNALFINNSQLTNYTHSYGLGLDDYWVEYRNTLLGPTVNIYDFTLEFFNAQSAFINDESLFEGNNNYVVSGSFVFTSDDSLITTNAQNVVDAYNEHSETNKTIIYKPHPRAATSQLTFLRSEVDRISGLDSSSWFIIADKNIPMELYPILDPLKDNVSTSTYFHYSLEGKSTITGALYEAGSLPQIYRFTFNSAGEFNWIYTVFAPNSSLFDWDLAYINGVQVDLSLYPL